MRENVEFVTKASETIEKAISIKPNEEEVQLLDDKESAPQEQQYCLVRDRIRRQIKQPQRYAYADLLLMHLVWQKTLKMRNLKLIMKSSLVESLHSGLLQ